jgi:hypothetical protein
MGTRIKDAALVGSVSEGYKIPVSDGSNQPKTASVGQLSEFVNQKYGVEQKLSQLGLKWKDLWNTRILMSVHYLHKGKFSLPTGF